MGHESTTPGTVALPGPMAPSGSDLRDRLAGYMKPGKATKGFPQFQKPHLDRPAILKCLWVNIPKSSSRLWEGPPGKWAGNGRGDSAARSRQGQRPPPWLPAQWPRDVSGACPSPAALQLALPRSAGLASCPSRRRAQQSQRNKARPGPGRARPRSPGGSWQRAGADTGTSAPPHLPELCPLGHANSAPGTTHLAGGQERALHPGLQLPRSSKVPTNLHKLPAGPCPVCWPETTGFWSLSGGS